MNTRGIRSDLYEIDLLCRNVEQKSIENLIAEEYKFLNYWGRYLGEMDGVWVDERSIYYEKCYIEGCRLLALEHEHKKEFEAAIRLYQNILLINSYEEETVKRLLTCYCEIGDWKRMKQFYKDFTKHFKDEMGIDSQVSLEKILTQRKHRN